MKTKFEKKYKVLFVCLGNICRSPSAETIFNKLIIDNSMLDKISCDSAGTYGGHSGEKADARMRKHALKRGYDIVSRSRQFNPEFDFDNSDMIIAMDDSNMNNLKAMCRNESDEKKLRLAVNFSKKYNYSEVPDPYYGGDKGFELVIDLLEDICQGIYQDIIS
ncbi:MAG: low molecular weight phosphotyrosine protein phosphatase [Marinifilaceae bacterium]|jgi:protein-tyrosine phosphatase|nr:low molecular weight phosphotyrosine protein phosphatase [Marinifilaceae bacterium]